jgi:hypothetical protein
MTTAAIPTKLHFNPKLNKRLLQLGLAAALFG